MPTFLRHRSGLGGWVLLSIFLIATSVTCIATAEMTPAQQDCCARMAAGCDATMAADHGCCPTRNVRTDQQLTPTPRTMLPAPHQVVVSLPASGSMHLLAASIEPPVAFHSPPRPAGAGSSYLRLVSLRI